METNRRVNLLSTVNMGRLQRIGGKRGRGGRDRMGRDGEGRGGEKGRGEEIGWGEMDGGREREEERCRFIVRLITYSKAIGTYFSFLVLPSPKIRLST